MNNMDDNNRQNRRGRYLNWNTGGLNVPQVLFLVIFFYCTLFLHIIQLAYSYLMGKVCNKSKGLIVYSNERPKSSKKKGEASGAGGSGSSSKSSNSSNVQKEKKFGDTTSKEEVKKKNKIQPKDTEI
ncbi:hypothetical protein GE061_014775 [Apolygus lucorum]|uniref:Uncharacterized protein n=1 Tax=Apolygus lucorum TaxID=248454 RepID=A0A8S9XJ42_APOLU|nr:hypothetical protein GE061_014775 [Apolygus lucorum]